LVPVPGRKVLGGRIAGPRNQYNAFDSTSGNMKRFSNQSVDEKTLLQESNIQDEEMWDIRMWNPVLLSIYHKSFIVT